MEPGELRTVIRDGSSVVYLCCPGCGLEATLDDDQLHGRVSVDCPECEYHETVDWSDRK